jgi:hypothetical protein
MPVVNVKGMGLMRILQQAERDNPPAELAGLYARADKQRAFDDRVQGVLSGIGNQIADVAINDEGGLNNPAQLKAALDNKFQEVRNFTDMVTQGLTPTQKAAFLTMGVNGLGDITGLAADIEMYITDPESRTWFNAMMSSAGVAGGAVSISPSMAAMLPIIRKNIDAWHGSPHKFDAFSMSRIGTGEGAQAYGHGLYFAENKSVSENYAKVLGDDMNAYQGAMDDVNRAVSPHTDFQNSEYMVNWAYEGGYDPKKESLYDFMVKEIDEGGYTLEQPDGVDIQGILKAAQDPEVIKATDRMVMPVEPTLYNVDLKVSPDDLLDWDAPVNKKMQDLLDELAVSSGRGDKWLTPQESWADYTGAQAYDNLGDYFTSAEEASKFLNEKGIPGIRYLDGTSRSAGEGTRNFVIFDDSLIDIKKRNGEVLTPVQREEAVTSMTSGFSDSTSYRGMTQPYDESKVSNIIWTTDNPKYAGEYASRDGAFGGNIMPLNVKAENPFNFGFRNISTEVKYGDVLDRVRRGIDDAFTNNSIGREEGINLMDKLEDLRDSADLSEMRPVHGWWNNNYELTDILKSAGYDGISAKEGINNNIQTIGVFNKNQVRSIFDKEAGAGEMMGGDTVSAAMPEIRPARENLRDVIDSNFSMGSVGVDEMVSLDNLSTSMSPSVSDARRADELANKIQSGDGYIERIIVDNSGNVIEGQHRTEAMKRLGYSEIPATIINDLSGQADELVATGIRPEHARQIIDEVDSWVRNGESVSDYVVAPEFKEQYLLAEKLLVK